MHCASRSLAVAGPMGSCTDKNTQRLIKAEIGSSNTFLERGRAIGMRHRLTRDEMFLVFWKAVSPRFSQYRRTAPVTAVSKMSLMVTPALFLSSLTKDNFNVG